MKCSACGASLTGGSDTFGSRLEPLCQAHWLEALERSVQPRVEVVELLNSHGKVIEISIRVVGEEESDGEEDERYW